MKLSDRIPFSDMYPTPLRGEFVHTPHSDKVGYISVNPRWVDHIGTSVNKRGQPMRDFIDSAFGKSILGMSVLRGHGLFIASCTEKPPFGRTNPDKDRIEDFCKARGLLVEVSEVVIHSIYTGLVIKPTHVYSPLQYRISRIKAITVAEVSEQVIDGIVSRLEKKYFGSQSLGTSAFETAKAFEELGDALRRLGAEGVCV